MVPFEGNQNQHLRLGQEEPVRMWHHRFRSRKAGVGGGPPLLVLLVLISDDVSATTVATFRFMLVGDLRTFAHQVFINYSVVTYFLLAPR